MPPRHPPPVARVIGVAAAVVGLLLVLAPAYGFHRDELYFIVAGRHPDWGYPDQPPLAPLLAAGAVALAGLEPWAVRVLPALAVGLTVLLAAAIARELGGSPRAQAIAAVTLGGSGYLAAGHLGVTATYDLLAWAAILWLTSSLLRGADERRWLLVGLVAGIGLQNKHLVLFLAGGLVAGLVVHRRSVLRSPWPWAGAVLALALWAPNLAWQVANGLPQLEMARGIAEDGDDRLMVGVELLLLAGPLLAPITLAGLERLLRDPGLVPFRPLGTAFLAILAVILVAGGKSYYVVGAVPPLMAAGAIAVDRWLARGGRARASLLAAATAGSVALVALLTLPVLPASTLARTPIPEIYGETADQVGWPELVATVEGVVQALPGDDRARAVVLTANYGEAGALQLLGGPGMPPVVSGHNAIWGWARPTQDRDVVVLVGWWGPEWRGALFTSCRQAATVRNAVDMPNEEQGAPVHLCTGLRNPWSVAWPEVRHLD